MNLTRIFHWLGIVFLFLTFSCSQKKQNETNSYGKATTELVRLVEKDPQLRAMLEASIEKARQINPDKTTNPAQSLDEFYAFASQTETALPWSLRKFENESTILDNMMQAFCAFYFSFDQPVPELEGKGYFHNSLQYAEPFASWLTKFNLSWGGFLDTEQSWKPEYVQLMSEDPAFGLKQGWYEDPSHWKTFNQFFARRLSSPAARPIASPEDESVVASFADAVPQGVWAIDANSNLVSEGGVTVKSATLKSVSKLIGDDSKYKNAFANGTFTHSFLNVNDYHRYHFPLSGTVKEARIIKGTNPSGGVIEWKAEQKRYIFNPSETGWQTVETRGCVILETKEYGLVALLPIGMAVVGSVNLDENVKEGAIVKKGDSLGHFLFGGSDFIMIFSSKATFTLDAPKQDDHNYKHLLMGERLGSVKKK